MLKKTITYRDFNDLERTEDYYFNITKSEIAEKQFIKEGGLYEWMVKIAKEKDIPKLAELFKNVILSAYGEKTEDGKGFYKSEEMREKFHHSAAYDALYMELFSDIDTFIAFIINCLPSDMQEEIKKKMKAAMDDK